MVTNIKIIGTESVRREISVHPHKLIETIISLIKSNYPKHEDNFVDSEGMWQMFEYVGGHNNDEHYTLGGPATDEDKQVAATIDLLQKLKYK